MGGKVQFNFKSYTEQHNLIDKNTFDPFLQIQMLRIGNMYKTAISPWNTTAGEVTNYNFRFVSNADIEDGDYMEIHFPMQLTLPIPYFLNCTSKEKRIIEMYCTRPRIDVINVHFQKVKLIKKTTEFMVTIQGIKNYYSTKPTDYFGKIFQKDRGGQAISQSQQ